MPARRFFVRDRHEAAERVAIEGADAHKIAHVLRLRTGDTVEIVDSAAQVFAASLSIDGSRVEAILDRCISALDEARELRIDIAQGIPKGAKMDYVVEKLSELGVGTLIPLRSERVIASEVSQAKIDRWRRLAQSAAAQSGRTRIMTVEEPLDLTATLERAVQQYDLMLMPWEAAEPQPPARELPSLLARVQSVLVLIGPEGGFSHAEAEAAGRSGAHLISLGSQILRTETAGLVAAAILRYEWDR
jgi:16S rRNA (uracil1498-N3)-methyltransferase